MTDSIGERLKAMRQSRGLTLRQLATLAHVPLSTLSSVESGVRSGSNLTLETGKRLARALGISLDVIAGVYEEERATGEGEPAPVKPRGRRTTGMPRGDEGQPAPAAVKRPRARNAGSRT